MKKKTTLFQILRFAFCYLLFDALILGYAGFLPGVQLAAAQVQMSNTTLNAAVTSKSTTYISVTSNTGILAGYNLYIDQEFLVVNAVIGTTGLQVGRGYDPGSTATTHLSGAIVWFGPPSYFYSYDPQGSCARGAAAAGTTVQSFPVVPWINPKSGNYSDCLNGVSVVGDSWPLQVTGFRVLSANSGGTAYTSLNTNGTTLVAGTLYCSELDMPFNKLLTGLAVLNGTTAGGTDKHLVALLDAGGNVLATSALGGAASSGTSAYQQYAFTAKYFAVGPAQYFACVQSNGTTDTIRMLVTGTQDTYLTTSKTGSFGTIPTITVPTTFTTAVGPYAYAY